MVHKPRRYSRPSSRGIWFLPKTIEKLAAESGVSPALLKLVFHRRFDPYVEFKMQKKTNGFRTIAVPDKNFKPALNYLLSTFNPRFIHESAWAYQPGKSAAACARVHDGIAWGIKVDLKDFFGSVDEEKVYLALTRSGFSRQGARLLSRTTTRLKLGKSDSSNRYFKRGYAFQSREVRRPVRFIRTRVRTVGHLPQGSPTSGYLSNLVAWDLDSNLSELAQKSGMKYTRYSDDILFSSPSNDFNRETALILLSEIRRRCNTYGFELNNRKTRLLTPGARKQYLGLLLNSPGVRLTVEKRKALETTIWALEKYGVIEHSKHLGFTSESADNLDSNDIGELFFNKFWGQISYVLDVDKPFARKLLNRLLQLGNTDEYLKETERGRKIVAEAGILLSQQNRWAV